jgi:3-dehydroquinate dehydratase I
MPKIFFKLLNSATPATVGVLSDPEVLRQTSSLSIKDQEQLCDVFEIRQDLLGLSPKNLLAAIEPLSQPLLLTLRHPAEGGGGPTDAAERSALLEPLLHRVHILDVEIQFAPQLRGVIAKAQSLGVQVVGSFHDFHATPSTDVLTQAKEQAQSLGLDGAKFACFLQTTEDLSRLMQLFGDPLFPLSVMGMGPLGRVSRLLLSRLGSVLNYGYLGEANAPGQWPAPQLKQLIAQL